jgi:hypothetical protein
MPNRVETAALSEGDQTWLASTRGLDKNPQGKLKLSTFTPTDGYIKSGTPVAKIGTGLNEELVKYVPGASDGTQILAGFLRNDVIVVAGSTDVYANVAFIDHGRIRIGRLPVAFVVPAKANDNGLFTYVTN